MFDKIALRVFLAFTCRNHIFTSNFSSIAQKGIVIFNYHYFPLLFIGNYNGEIKLNYIYSDKEMYNSINRYFSLPSISKKIDYVVSCLERYTDNIRNFRICVFNDIMKNGIDGWDFLIKQSETVSYEQAKKILIQSYDIRLCDFEKIFGQNNNENTNTDYKIDGMNFRCSNAQYTYDDINNVIQEIKRLLPNSLKSTLYGEFEIRNEFAQNRDGDYSYSRDIIRVGGDKNNLIKVIIHELAHRWHNKFATKQQIKQFKKAFDNANGKHLQLNKKDIVQLYGYEQSFIYQGIALGSMMLTGKDDNKLHLFKIIATRSITSINGQKVEKYQFPSPYSRTQFAEFIAQCILYTYTNETMDQKLKQKVKWIIGE